MSATVEKVLNAAWARRAACAALQDSNALRVFHGAGEVLGDESKESALLKSLSVDRFGEHAWVTLWETQDGDHQQFEKLMQKSLCDFLRQHFASAVLQLRPRKGTIADPTVLFGNSPTEHYTVHEGSAQYRVQMHGVKHPGLFLDHAPLRAWLIGNSKNLRVLNTFAYTGSLSVAAALGGAAHVTTLDLSKATMRCAYSKQEWK